MCSDASYCQAHSLCIYHKFIIETKCNSIKAQYSEGSEIVLIKSLLITQNSNIIRWEQCFQMVHGDALEQKNIYINVKINKEE